MINQIICGDCLEVMKEIPDKSIDLTITSPPYDNLRDYKGYVFNFKGIANELYRIIKQGGVVVWVVGDATVDGSETGTSFKQALYFKEIGFNLHDTMIYKKSHFAPYDPKCNRYYQEFEYMFVLSKGKIFICNYIKEDCKHSGKKKTAYSRSPNGNLRLDRKEKTLNHIIKDKKIKANIWEYSNLKRFKHPAPFPEQLANDHILSWSNKGDIVLDPMCGSGTTCKMAKKLGRNYIGIDISSEYCEIANNRIKAVPELLPY